MHLAQLDRLKKDSRELEHYIHRLEKKGRKNLAYKINRKRKFLDQHIFELESEQK